MNEKTKLPDGLELAENLCSHAWHVGGCSTDRLEFAVSAIRTEHSQRLTLQHHCADLAQRVADLGAESDAAQQAIAEARADGAREMREAIAAECGRTYTIPVPQGDAITEVERECYPNGVKANWVRAMPLPDRREPVRLTDEQVRDCIDSSSYAVSQARAIEAAALAANGLTK